MNKLTILFYSLFSISANAQWEMLNPYLSVDHTAKPHYRAIDVVSKRVIWAGGSQSSVLRTTNGGKSWQTLKVPQAGLDFRGITALDTKTAIVVSAGEAEKFAANIFKTTDAGQTWSKVFETVEQGVFLDGVTFFDKKHGLVIGDPLNNQAYVLETKDGGDTWKRMPAERFPKLEKGEASFAASNSGIVTVGNKVWYALQSRILYSENRGKSWVVLESHFPNGETNGIFGLYFWSESEGLIMGGDYIDDKSKQVNLAKTKDGGKTWTTKEILFQGLKESAAMAKGQLIAVGTSGTSISNDKGKTWTGLDTESFHAIGCAKKTCFAVGANGHIGKIRLGLQ